MLADLKGAPNGLLELLAAIASLPWWGLITVAAIALGFQGWWSYQLVSLLADQREQMKSFDQMNARLAKAVEKLEGVDCKLADVDEKLADVDVQLDRAFSEFQNKAADSFSLYAKIAPHIEKFASLEELIQGMDEQLKSAETIGAMPHWNSLYGKFSAESKDVFEVMRGLGWSPRTNILESPRRFSGVKARYGDKFDDELMRKIASFLEDKSLLIQAKAEMSTNILPLIGRPLSASDVSLSPEDIGEGTPP